MATPFDADGEIDLEAARRLARYLITNGSHGLVVAGTTGESPTLDDNEKLSLLRAVLDEVGEEATVIFGSGSNDTRHSVELTMAGAELGADAALIVTPYYNRPNPAGIREHFAAVAGGSPELPIVIYNIPSRVIVNIGPAFLAELAEIPNVVAVKQANDDELAPIDGLDVLAGNDGVFMQTLEFGGAGGILVASHLVGPQMRAIWNLAEAGDLAGAREIDQRISPAYEAMGVTTNPIPLKAALEMLGLDTGYLRLPMVSATEEERRLVRSKLEEAGVTL